MHKHPIGQCGGDTDLPPHFHSPGGDQRHRHGVVGALHEFAATQHLVGTQIAEVHNLPGDDHAAGKGTLFSHLQAWHAKPDGDMWHYIGIYEANVVCHPGMGWKIAEMNLRQVSEDYRKISPRP